MEGDNYKNNKINTEHEKELQKEVEYWKDKWEEEKQQLLQLKGLFKDFIFRKFKYKNDYY